MRRLAAAAHGRQRVPQRITLAFAKTIHMYKRNIPETNFWVSQSPGVRCCPGRSCLQSVLCSASHPEPTADERVCRPRQPTIRRVPGARSRDLSTTG